MKYPQIRKYIRTGAEKQIPVCHVSEKQNFWPYSAPIAIPSPENTRFSFTFMLFNNTRRAFLSEKHLQLTLSSPKKQKNEPSPGFSQDTKGNPSNSIRRRKTEEPQPPILYTYYTPKNPTTLYSKPG
jgi:hypothetical protein